MTDTQPQLTLVTNTCARCAGHSANEQDYCAPSGTARKNGA
jgi:hypothetical protein